MPIRGRNLLSSTWYRDAAEVLDALVLDDDFVEFLTLPACERLVSRD